MPLSHLPILQLPIHAESAAAILALIVLAHSEVQRQQALVRAWGACGARGAIRQG